MGQESIDPAECLEESLQWCGLVALKIGIQLLVWVTSSAPIFTKIAINTWINMLISAIKATFGSLFLLRLLFPKLQNLMCVICLLCAQHEHQWLDLFCPVEDMSGGALFLGSFSGYSFGVIDPRYCPKSSVTSQWKSYFLISTKAAQAFSTVFARW